MGKIFLRIYGGTIGLILLTSILMLSILTIINEWRKHQYTNELVAGTLWLISENADQYTREFQPYWLEYIGNKIETPIELINCNKYKLGIIGQYDFSSGYPVIIPQKNSQERKVIYPHQKEKYDNECIYTSLTNVFSPKTARITSALILEQLNTVSPSDYKNKLAEISERLNYKVNTINLEEAKPFLEPNEIKQLNELETVTRIGKNQDTKNELWFYRLNNDKNILLEIGPVKLFDDYPHTFSIIAVIVGVIIVTTLAFSLVRPLRQSLKQLEDAALDVSQGRLSSKVSLKKNSPIYELGVVFNGMTSHISRLIHAQQDLIRAVSHELRTPIARLRFGIEILVDEDNPEKREQKANQLDNDIEQLNELVDEIITFMRLEQGAPKMEFESLNIKTMLKQLRAELLPIAENSNRSISVKRFDAESPVEAEIHPRYWNRAIQNLVTNAIKYGCNKTVISYHYDPESDLCSIWVEDDGTGIPLSEREKIFEPFSRLDSSRTAQKIGGYGLGLSIVKRISYWHGGTISVDMSPELQGARFIFTWPRQQPTHHILATN